MKENACSSAAFKGAACLLKIYILRYRAFRLRHVGIKIRLTCIDLSFRHRDSYYRLSL